MSAAVAASVNALTVVRSVRMHAVTGDRLTGLYSYYG